MTAATNGATNGQRPADHDDDAHSDDPAVDEPVT